MSFFKKDAPTGKPNFSNVKSGSSSTGDAPRSPEMPRKPDLPGFPGTPGTRPDFSNVRSGSSSTAPVHDAPGTTTYIVRSGDSLSKIAKRHYGDAKLWPRIHAANLEVLGKNPDLIQPGQTLVLPPV
jgi:nucleoid-associated protein YgaU